MDTITKYFSNVAWENIAIAGIRIVLILIGIRVLIAVARALLRRLERLLITRGQETGEMPAETAKRAETLARLLRQAVVIVIWVMGSLMILRELGVDIGPVLAGAGIIGLAVGFGAQNLVRDVISGFFILLENQVRVGDVAIINGTGGLVERINFRCIVLRDVAGIVHVFPNGTINTLSNMTREWSAYVLDIGVAYKEDTDRVVEIMKQTGAELQQDDKFGPLMQGEVEIFGVDKFADSAVIIKGRIKTQPIKQWEVGREYLRRLKKAFDAAGIEIPFPHQSLYFGEASKPFLAQLLNTTEGRTPGSQVDR